MGILIFKWLDARRLCKSFGVKGLTATENKTEFKIGFSEETA
jgi:hypothetical protein